MNDPYDHEVSAAQHGSISTIVTNSPTSLSTSITDLHTGIVSAAPGMMMGIAATTTCTSSSTSIIGSQNSICCSDSNMIDTTTSTTTDSHTTGSIIISGTDCPIRASGQVCICDLCETSRLHLLQQSQRHHHGNTMMMNEKKLRHSQEIEPVINQNVTTHRATSSDQNALVVRNKRSRAAYKYDDDDDDDDNDKVDHCDHPISSTKINEDTMAVTEVVTTTAHSIVNNNNNNNNDDDDTESQKLRIMSQACRTILQCIGEDPDREGLQKTPERWAKALLYLCHGYHLSPSQVTNNAVFYENHNEMVVVRNIDIHSLCEHHMVPFTGHVHIGYIPNGKIIGLSKLARLADLFARRLQVQERLTRQIADAILETITPLGVAVVMECTHYCMVMRGVQKTGTITTTSSVRGCFETNSKTRAEFFSILHGGGK